MIIEHIEKEFLYTIRECELTEKKAAEFFCKNTYKYLYVIRDEIVISILNKNDVPKLGSSLLELVPERYIISSEFVTDKFISDIFRKRAFVNRIAILDNDRKLLGEYNNGSLPIMARNIKKNKMSLRYAPLFTDRLKQIFAENHWNSALVLGNMEVFLNFKKAFPWLKAEFSESYHLTEHNVIFNFCYHNKLMHYFCSDSRIKEISKVIEKAAFSVMLNYLKSEGVRYHLLRAPVYERLTCLSTDEMVNMKVGRSQRDLIYSDEYMKHFINDSQLILNLRNGYHLDSFIEDNGWIFVQHNSSNEMFAVCDGKRITLPDISRYKSSVHMYGSCFVYGFMVKDDETICSLLQKKDICQNIRVLNHGALLGRNLLNMIMDVLSTELRGGDTVVLVDIFEGIADDSQYGIIDTNNWFNHSKPCDEIWFLDFPLHCNTKANQLVADGIATLLAETLPKDEYSSDMCSFVQKNNCPIKVVYYYLHKKLTDYERIRIKELTASAGAVCRFIDAVGRDSFSDTVDLFEIGFDEQHAIVHYGLDNDYRFFPQHHFFIESADMLTARFLMSITETVSIHDKRVLLYLGKFPEKSSDIDGGAQLAKRLISSLSSMCQLDVTFIRKEKETYSNPHVKNVRYEEYIDPYGNKFSRRMKNFGTNRSAIINGNDYDLIIAGHCSKFFGIENETALMQKAVIFPMMLTSGYKRSGETVSQEYTERERMVLTAVSEIITPSLEEFDDIVNDYDVPVSKIRVIPRGIAPVFKAKLNRRCSDTIQLVSIGSFKSQKNHISELRVFKILIDSGVTNVHFTMIGAIHDRRIYKELIEYISSNNLTGMVTLYHNISQRRVAALLDKMDICISCSLWETFGRGVFECMTVGLPCVLSDKLDVIKRYAVSEKNVFFCATDEEMVNAIKLLSASAEIYDAASSASLNISRQVSYSTECERLITVLLFDRFGYKTQYMGWHSDEYEVIWKGTFSECRRKGNRVRKYYRYPNEEKIKAEFYAQQCAFENGIPTAEPLYLSLERDSDQLFIESRLIRHMTASNQKLSEDTINKLISITDIFTSLPIDSLRPFSYFRSEFTEAMVYYCSVVDDNILTELEWLFNLECQCFVHGDLLLKNIGICNGEVYLFDFQNACCGPENWDKAYLFSELMPDTVKPFITEKICRFIRLILKLRIGRAIRRGNDYAEIMNRLLTWTAYFKGARE